MTTPPTPDAGVSHTDAMLCAKHIVALRAKYEGHRDTYAHGEHNLALAYLALTAQLAAAKADGERLDWIDKCDLDALHNTMGLIADGNGARYVIDNAIKADAARTGAR